MPEQETHKIPFFVISLDRTPERFAEFSLNNAKSEIDFIKVPAIDGTKINRDELTSIGLIEHDLDFRDNAIACSLSHIMLWEKAIHMNCNVIICEDDATIHNDFTNVLQRAMQMVSEFDILYFGFNFDMHINYEIPGFGDCISIFDEKRFSSHENLIEFQNAPFGANIYRVKRLYGAICYAISPQGAAKLLAQCLPLKNGSHDYILPVGLGRDCTLNVSSKFECVDTRVGLQALENISAYGIIPPIVIAKNDKTNTTIWEQD